MPNEQPTDGASSDRRELLNISIPATADDVAKVSDKVAEILLGLAFRKKSNSRSVSPCRKLLPMPWFTVAATIHRKMYIAG